MGGERLHLQGLTEISAICSHPDYQGKGYGAKITQFLAKLVMKKGETPFLHARVDNIKAMDGYKRLGFETAETILYFQEKRYITPADFPFLPPESGIV
ncbi:MAG: GNAT family N-acetyltransferase [Chitinophagaceae bacterium]|nr:GNAT family N-acetyltransferase [Chitinophagaceae bacterium]